MSDKTGISWTEATWNPCSGCTKVSAACKFCYAERDWPRLVHLPAYAGRKFTDVACHPERLDQPLRWKRPRRIFVNSMGDLFHEDVPDGFIDQVFAVMGLSYVTRETPHIFQVLTKRPERMHAYLNDPDTAWRVTRAMKAMGPKGGLPGENSSPTWPLPNVWLGVSIEDQATADERILLLLETPAAVRWISAEPLLGQVDLSVEYMAMKCGGKYPFKRLPAEHRTKIIDLLDWVVCGGESGPKARPMHRDWARSLRDQCEAANTPYYFKQWGEFAPVSGLGGVTMARVGRKQAGRLLDGKLHDDYPEAR